MANCPSCNTPVDASQRFCPKCGALQPAEAGGEADPMVGKTIASKYRIVKLLGEGGMGAVYQGEQQMGTKTRPVAIKTLHPHLSKDPKVRARFDREVGTIAELEHPNTIQVYDFGTTEDGLLYLVMEFINGTNVADILEKTGALEPPRVEKIMTQVCGSLEEAHSRGIIHRDLKPENVVLTERAGQKDFVKVLDFGIAKRSHEEDKQEQKLTQQGMVLGTPPYMSPEQFTGKPIDARSDIYSLGVMMYEMLTGRLPFNANTAWEWATQHMTVPPLAIESSPNGAQVPQQMRAAIMKALEKDPNARWATVREFSDAFHGATAGMAPMSVPRPGTAPLAVAGSAMGIAPAATPAAAQPAPDAQKGKTQMGEPLMAPGAFGGGPPGPGGAPAYGAAPVQAQATPSAGNLAVPAIPAGPARTQGGGGGGKGGILAVLGIVGLLSIGAIAYAVIPHHSSGGGGFVLEAGTDPTPVNLTATAAPNDTAPPTLDTSIATLSNRPTPPPPHPGGQTHHDAGAPQPHPSGGGTTPTPPGPGPTPPGPGPTPPGPKPLPPDVQAACATAGRLKNNPNVNSDDAMRNMFNNARAKCMSGGGTF